MSLALTTPQVANDQDAARRLKSSDPVYCEIQDFLIDEATLLDDDKHREWLTNYLHPDILYLMPVRKSVMRRDGAGFDEDLFHFNETMKSLDLRVKRSVEIPSAYDRDPAPRIRRMITNIAVSELPSGDLLAVSSILVVRNRFDDTEFKFLCGKREDIIRRTPEGLKILKRLVLLDQSAMGWTSLNLFM